jgi:hypothetical protein
VHTEKSAHKHFNFSELNVKKDEKVVGKCKLCPGNVVVSGRTNVSSNFILHLKVWLMELLRYFIACVVGVGKSVA